MKEKKKRPFRRQAAIDGKIGVYLPLVMRKKLDEVRRQSGITLSEVLRRGVELLFDYYLQHGKLPPLEKEYYRVQQGRPRKYQET